MKTKLDSSSRALDVAREGLPPAPSIRNRNHRMKVTVEMAVAPDDALTQQQFKDECDMNRIVKNAARGIAPKFLARGAPQYGDFSNVPDLTSAYETIERAESAFMNLPAELRLELGNNPANISKLTGDQIKRYKLDRGSQTPSPADPVSSPSAGQAQPAGTEPADPKPPKGGAKKSSNDDV